MSVGMRSTPEKGTERLASKDEKFQDFKNGLKFLESFKESFTKFQKVSQCFTKFQPTNWHAKFFDL